MKYIKKGDKIVLRVHGKPVGIYVLGEVIKNPYKRKIDLNEHKYYIHSEGLDHDFVHVKIKYLYKLFTRPISNEYTRKLKISSYRDKWVGTFLNPPLPDKDQLPPPVKLTGSEEQLIDHKVGKIDTYGWIPMKPIWEDVWLKIIKIVDSGEWF